MQVGQYFYKILMILFLWVMAYPAVDSLSSISGVVQWTDSIPADFSFTQKWSYPENLSDNSNEMDTTKRYHTLSSDAQMYEFLSADFVHITQINDSTFLAQSECNMATHSSLNIKLKGDQFESWIEYAGVAKHKVIRFPFKHGTLQVDSNLWKKGVFKAKFDFYFRNQLDSSYKLYWKGLILKDISK